MNDRTANAMSEIWKISADAKKPEEPRKDRKSEESTLNYYNENAGEFAAGTVNVRFTEMQDLFLEYVPEGGKILDFGCGSGRDTKYFLSRGYRVDAADGSEELCNIAGAYAEKQALTLNVPYKALSGFANKSGERIDLDSSAGRMMAYYNKLSASHILLPYTFGSKTGLSRKLTFNDAWIQMIKDNTVNILGWIQCEKVRWLQNNSPEVPGLIYKLAPLDEKMRKLSHVRKLWDGILDVRSVADVFTDEAIDKQKYEVDHFIPWFFVMNDELWNLMPMDSSLNSAKNQRSRCKQRDL